MSKIPRCDYHIHTKYLRCANESMEVAAIARECERVGLTSIGITDHLNYFEQADLHLRIKEDILALNTKLDVHFGVELNFCALDGEFAFNAELKEKYAFQFAIGGIHSTYMDSYDLKKIIDIQHRHHLKVCADPLVDVLVHPYWFNRGEFNHHKWPIFESMQAVPKSYARELGQTAKATGTAIEINACANLLPHYGERFVKEYIEYLAIVAEEGACFCMGSDAHSIEYLQKVEVSWQVAKQLKLTPDRIWQPGKPPLKKASV